MTAIDLFSLKYLTSQEEAADGGLVYSWAMHRVTAYLTVLQHMLPRITEGSPLSNVLDHCMVRLRAFRLSAPSVLT